MSIASFSARAGRSAFAACVVAALVGCAHPISLSPSLQQLGPAGAPTKSAMRIGLLLGQADRLMSTTTPGGGGDSVSYMPYRDLEAGLYFVLAQRFASVTLISNTNDAKIAAEDLSLLVSPRVLTTSSSPSLVTWPPTRFTVELQCKVTDRTGRLVTEFRVVGDGNAEFDEFKLDPSLSARRASEQALRKLASSLDGITDAR